MCHDMSNGLLSREKWDEICGQSGDGGNGGDGGMTDGLPFKGKLPKDATMEQRQAALDLFTSVFEVEAQEGDEPAQVV